MVLPAVQHKVCHLTPHCRKIDAQQLPQITQPMLLANCIGIPSLVPKTNMGHVTGDRCRHVQGHDTQCSALWCSTPGPDLHSGSSSSSGSAGYRCTPDRAHKLLNGNLHLQMRSVQQRRPVHTFCSSLPQPCGTWTCCSQRHGLTKATPNTCLHRCTAALTQARIGDLVRGTRDDQLHHECCFSELMQVAVPASSRACSSLFTARFSSVQRSLCVCRGLLHKDVMQLGAETPLGHTARMSALGPCAVLLTSQASLSCALLFHKALVKAAPSCIPFPLPAPEALLVFAKGALTVVSVGYKIATASVGTGHATSALQDKARCGNNHTWPLHCCTNPGSNWGPVAFWNVMNQLHLECLNQVCTRATTVYRGVC